jgi:hypothetical protein
VDITTIQDVKIKDVVEIHGGYTAYVDLGLELFDDSRNVERMARYRPIASHRQAFQRLARALDVKDKRCYLLTGSYGTGKSHLCLMFANYLQTPADERPMPEFLAHYADSDAAAAEKLAARRTKGRYLVALCEWGGRGDFDEVVLRAVDEALRREGFGEDFDTQYDQALKKIAKWEALERTGDQKGHFFTDLKAALSAMAPPQTLSGFSNRLRGFDFTALEDFKRLHLDLTTAPFVYDKDNLLDIITSTLASARFKERFLGLLVLFDEFGDTLERGHMSPKLFQQFGQLAADPPAGCARLIFVGTAHKTLTAYGKDYSSVDFRTASDRVEEVALTTEGVEDLISAIVRPRRDDPLWTAYIAPRAAVFDSLVTDCKRLKLFDWLTSPQIRRKIIEGIYPMHPMATHALLRLAQDVASNNRSVYTFFSGDLADDAPGSYGRFVAETPVEQGGKVALYTADLLCDYFADTLTSDNRELRDTIRDIVKDYEHTRRELNRVVGQDAMARAEFLADPLIERLLRLVLIYEIVGVPVSFDNLQFGLYRTTEGERAELHNRLARLSEKGVLYYVKDAGVYEFKKSSSIDLDRLIESYKQDPEHEPSDLVAELNLLVPFDKRTDSYLEAKDYNQSFGEDKRLERRLVRPADLGTEIDTPTGKRSYFAGLEDELRREAGRGEREGFALYAVCQTIEEVSRAKDLAGRNTSERVVVAVPKVPVPLRDAVMTLRALEEMERTADTLNFTVQDKARLQARLDGEAGRPGARDALRARRDQLLNPREVVWYARYAGSHPANETRPYDAANLVMSRLYDDGRNRFPHDDFNKLRLKTERVKNTGLKDAIEHLLDYASDLAIDTAGSQRGENRYLQRCLLNQGALREVRREGSKSLCEIERDTAKYRASMPALAAMVREVMALGPNDKLAVPAWLNTYREPPYGQGSIALSLALAYIRRMFGDSIRIKSDASAVGELPLREFDTVAELVEGRRPNAVLSYRPLRPEERALLNTIRTMFAPPSSAADGARDATVPEAYDALKAWWDGLPPLSQSPRLYPRQDGVHTAGVVDALTRIAAREPSTFLFDDLPVAFGAESGLVVTEATVEVIAKGLPGVKEALEGAIGHVADRIMDEVRQVFGVAQLTFSDIVSGVSEWYNALDTNQRDPHAPWQNHESKPLVVQMRQITDARATFLNTLPSSTDYGLGPVERWVSDRTEEYIGRIRRGKERIEAHRLKVASPEVRLVGAGASLIADGQVRFSDSVAVILHTEDKRTRVYVAEGSADPTDPNAVREEVVGDAPLTIREHKTLRYAAQDADGNWSRIETLALYNVNKEYEIAVAAQPQLDGTATAQLVFPRDQSSFMVTCRSLFTQALGRGAVTRDQLLNGVRAALAALEED